MNKRLVIVDDDGSNLLLEKDLLEAAGFEVFSAMNASDGIDLAGREKPDVIVMDVRLPDMPGNMAAKILRLDKATRDIPIVFVAGSVKVEGLEELRNMPNSSVIGKPINTRTFAAEIGKLIKIGV